MTKVRKAVITAAGWGTRFLPATKAQPKEMLPLIDKPLIQYAVEEVVASGIEQVIIVTAAGKRAIEDHFDRSVELERFLEQKGELELAERMRRLSELAEICYLRQKEQLGLGHAVLVTRNLVGKEPFVLLLPDDIIMAETPVTQQLLKVYQQYRSSVVAVTPVAGEALRDYGIIQPRQIEERLYQVADLVEKPEPEEAPSNLGIVGRYVLTPEVFSALAHTPPGKRGEIQLTDGLRLLLRRQPVYACEFEGTRYDAGTPLGYLEAQVALALHRDDVAGEFKSRLAELLRAVTLESVPFNPGDNLR